MSKNGTSQAAPHVAGAWALLKQYQPSATVDAVLVALQSTGLLVKDPRNDVVKPRIQVHGALLALPPRVDVHLLKAGAVVATIAQGRARRRRVGHLAASQDVGGRSGVVG